MMTNEELEMMGPTTEETENPIVPEVEAVVDVPNTDDANAWMYVAGTLLVGAVLGHIVEKHVIPGVKKLAKKVHRGIKNMGNKTDDTQDNGQPIPVDPKDVTVE